MTSLVLPTPTPTAINPNPLSSQFNALLRHLIQYQPSNAFEQIEALAAQISKQQLNTKTATPTANSSILTQDTEAAIQAWVNDTPYLFLPRPKPVNTTQEEGDEAEAEEEAPPTDIPAYLPNLSSSFSLLSECGVSLSPDELFYLDRALTVFSQTNDNVESIRFWGKIHTTNNQGDYYIIEVKKSDYTQEEEALQQQREKELKETGELVASTDGNEVYGSGVNEYVYYATQSITNVDIPWVALPAVTPAQIVRARSLASRLFSGDLSSVVKAVPTFPGNESNLLRATIARISHSTVVVPSGSWKEEEGEVIIDNEEWGGPAAGEKVTWQHQRGVIRREGRVEPAEEEDEAEDADLTEEQKAERQAAKALAEEAKLPLLRSTTLDTHKIQNQCWTYRTHTGLDTGYTPTPKQPSESEQEDKDDAAIPPSSVSHLVSSAHSVLWPGAVSAVRGREYVSVYIGWGNKKQRNAATRAPLLDPSQDEFADPPVSESAPTQQQAEEQKAKQDAEAEEEEEEDDLPDDENEANDEDDN